MAYPVITNCPVCSHKLKVTKLSCPHCRTTIENEFELSKLASLSKDQLDFVEVFLVCRGNIKEVEKELDISYPTVRSKLDDVISSLGYDVGSNERSQVNRREVLDLLSQGLITYEEALKMMKENSK